MLLSQQKQQQLLDKTKEIARRKPYYILVKPPLVKSALSQFTCVTRKVKPTTIFSTCLCSDNGVNVRIIGSCTVSQQKAVEAFSMNTHKWKDKIVRRIRLSPIHTTGSFWFCYDKPYELLNDSGADFKQWEWEVTESTRIRVNTEDGQILDINMYNAISKPTIKYDSNEGEMIDTVSGNIHSRISTILSQEDLMIPFYKVWFYEVKNVHSPKGTLSPLPSYFTAVWFEKGVDANGNQTLYNWVNISNFCKSIDCIKQEYEKKEDDLEHYDFGTHQNIFDSLFTSEELLQPHIDNLFSNMETTQTNYTQPIVTDITTSTTKVNFHPNTDNLSYINDNNPFEMLPNVDTINEEQWKEICDHSSPKALMKTIVDGTSKNVIQYDQSGQISPIFVDKLTGSTDKEEYVKVHITSMIDSKPYKSNNEEMKDGTHVLEKGSLRCDEPLFIDERDEVTVEILEMGKLGTKRKRGSVGITSNGGGSSSSSSSRREIGKSVKLNAKKAKMVQSQFEPPQAYVRTPKRKYIYFGSKSNDQWWQCSA